MRGKVRLWFSYSEDCRKVTIGTNSNRNDAGLLQAVLETVTRMVESVGLTLHPHDFHMHTSCNGNTTFFIPLRNEEGKIPDAFRSGEVVELPLAAEYRRTIY